MSTGLHSLTGSAASVPVRRKPRGRAAWIVAAAAVCAATGTAVYLAAGPHRAVY